MATGEITVYLRSELVVRESDGATLLLVEAHGGDPERPLMLEVLEG